MFALLPVESYFSVALLFVSWAKWSELLFFTYFSVQLGMIVGPK